MSEARKEWKLPKNTRQIGDGSGDRKLYIEDYVVTYLNRLSGQKETAKALLLGTVKEQNLYPYVFVDAAIEIEDFHMDEKQRTEMEQQIEKEFGIKKIVGWFFSSREKPVIYNQEVMDTYRQLFREENQVLMVSDPMEEELTAFFLEDEILTEQPGYFIYYEKNTAMQKLLIQNSAEQTNENTEQTEEHAIWRFRKKLSTKKTEKEAKEEERHGWMTYIAGGFLVMTVLALGVTIIYNYDRMKQVEQSLAILSNHVDSQREYVTDRAEDTEAVISYVTEDRTENRETDSEEIDDMVTEDKVLDDTAVNTQPETESEEMETQSEKATQTMGDSIARASYTIKVGDTLAGISEMYYGNVEKVQEICKLNGISEEDTILPGQKILLP